MKKLRLFYLVVVLAVSALLLSVVNVQAETWFAWYYHTPSYSWQQSSTGVPFNSYEVCKADWEAVCKSQHYICTKISGGIAVGERFSNGGYPMYFYCFPESYDPRKTGFKPIR